MSYPVLASDDHEIFGTEYCSGYSDVFGKWNNGFYCPQTPSNTAGFCCGTTVFKYCCTTKTQSSTVNEELYSILKQIPIVVAIICGVFAVVLSVIVASCYFCSCCVVYKKRRAHLPGGLYRLQGSSSTVSALGNIYAGGSQHNSLVSSPLGLDGGWHQPGPAQYQTALNSAAPNLLQLNYNIPNNNRVHENNFNNPNLYPSSNYTNTMLPNSNGNAVNLDHLPNVSWPNRNYYPSVSSVSRQNQIHNLSQAILQARGQSQTSANYRNENGYTMNGTRPSQYLTQQRVNSEARFSVPTTNYSQSNIRTNNKPLFYQNQSQILGLQSNRNHYHQTLANSIIMRANQYQRVLAGSMARSMSLSNPENHNQRRENIASGSSSQPESAQAINTNTLTSSSTSMAPLALEVPLSNTNGVAGCGSTETMANINISSETINPDLSNEITNGPPTTILSPSPSTSLTHQLQPNQLSVDDTPRKIFLDCASESVEMREEIPKAITPVSECGLVATMETEKNAEAKIEFVTTDM